MSSVKGVSADDVLRLSGIDFGSLGAELRRERERLGLSLADVAARAGTESSTWICAVESGRRCSIVGVVRLAEALDLRLRIRVRLEETSCRTKA